MVVGWPEVFGTRNVFTSWSNCAARLPLDERVYQFLIQCRHRFNYCNYWLSNGSGDGFAAHLQVAAQARAVADARVQRGMKVVCVEPRLSVPEPRR